MARLQQRTVTTDCAGVKMLHISECPIIMTNSDKDLDVLMPTSTSENIKGVITIFWFFSTLAPMWRGIFTKSKICYIFTVQDLSRDVQINPVDNRS